MTHARPETAARRWSILPVLLVLAAAPACSSRSDAVRPDRSPARELEWSDWTGHVDVAAGWSSDSGKTDPAYVAVGGTRPLFEQLLVGPELRFYRFLGGDGAPGVGAAALIRWEFLQEPAWKLYFDVTMGMLWASDEIPVEGTQFNFMYELGGGTAFRLSDDLWLNLGARFFHLSNAHLGDRNPSINGPVFLAGLTFEF